MSTALHRTDVAYVWPDTLVRPLPGVRLVYLDQNHWINLAKAAVGTPTGRPYRGALAALREARRSGRAVFPLSLTHVMESVTISRRQRVDIATIMEELSGFTTIISRGAIMRLELEAVLDAVAGRGAQRYTDVSLLAHGMAHAYGRRGGFRIINGRRDVTEEVRAEVGPEEFDRRVAQAEEDLNRAILRGPSDDAEEKQLRAQGWNPEIAFAIGDDRAQREREQAQRFDDKTLLPDDPVDYRRERVRDVVRARYVLMELMDMLNESLLARGLKIEDVWSDTASSQRLVDAMPSGDIAVTLLAEYHRDPTFNWKRNHIFDIDALSVAVPYCDLIATDKQAVDALNRSRVTERIGSQVFRNLDALVDAMS
jgi:hypothetical protein